MKNTVLLFILLLMLTLIIGCKSDKNSADDQNLLQDSLIPKHTEGLADKPHSNSQTMEYFKAAGTEPFWSLEIRSSGITLQTMEDTLKTPHVKPSGAENLKVRNYKVQTELTQIEIEIRQQECINQMSGETFPFQVTVQFQKGKEPESKSLEGCGNYLLDYRLNDIWVLEELNGQRVGESDFNGELPSLEIYQKKGSFSGFAGCNQIRGSLFYEYDLLRFIQIVTTRKICAQENKENEFLHILEAVTRYTLEDQQLRLFNQNGQVLVFRKID